MKSEYWTIVLFTAGMWLVAAILYYFSSTPTSAWISFAMSVATATYAGYLRSKHKKSSK